MLIYLYNYLLKQAKIPATAKEHLHAVCIKTGNLSRAERIRIEDQDFAVFDRKALLRVLNLYSGQNDILVDFRRHLKRWERETNSFQKWSRNEKKPERLERGWEGLYAWIEDHYQDKSDEKWGYLRSTLIGGFHGLSVVPTVTSKNSRFAMWIERDRISFRLYGAKRQESLKGMDREKQVWASRFEERGGGSFRRPSHLRPTKTKPMCVSEWRGWLEFGADDRIDLDRSVANIDRAKKILKSTIRYARR